MRLDRHYCGSRLFRDLVLEDGSVSEAECRANIAARNHTCYDEVCEQCTSQCTYPTARAVAAVAKCTVARGQLAFNYCLQVTDAGQLARASHGAKRSENYIAVRPSSATSHKSAAHTPLPLAGPRKAGRARPPHLPLEPRGLRPARQCLLS